MWTKPETKVRDVEIDGATIPIFVTDTGTFYARYDGERFEGTSLKTLTEKLKKHIRTSHKIAIPCSLFHIEWDYREGGEREDRLQVKQVILTGMHRRNRTILYREEGAKGAAGQQSTYGNSFYRRLTGAEIQEVFRLRRAKRDAEQTLEAYLEERLIDPKDEIRKVQAALDPESAEIDATGTEIEE